MGKVWMPGGGGGTDLDIVTAGKPDVLAGKVIVGKDGEPLTGTMPNNGSISQALNAGGSYTVPAGYHNGSGKITANSLASQTSATATAAHILSGQTAWVNGAKVNGGIPWQNAEVSGTDRAWSQGYSNWAGTINLKVRSGHYLNGVNWIQQDIPEYQPWNIKRGVNIGGVVGTFEGYVPIATDLYLRGNNIAGVTTDSPSNIIFESNMIRFNSPNAGYKLIIDNLNLTGYSNLNFEFISSNSDASVRFLFYITAAGASNTNSAIKRQDSYWGGSGVASLDIVLFDMNARIWLSCFSTNNIYRIWLS